MGCHDLSLICPCLFYLLLVWSWGYIGVRVSPNLTEGLSPLLAFVFLFVPQSSFHLTSVTLLGEACGMERENVQGSCLYN